MIPLRRFLYLDRDTVDNYLSVIEGGLSAGPISIKETGENSKGKKAGIAVQPLQVSGESGAKTTAEVQRTVVEPDALKFQKVYQYLDKNGPLTYLEIADEDVWQGLNRFSVVEVVGRIRLLRWQQMLELAEQMSPLVDLVEQFGQSVEPAARTALSGIKQLGAVNQGKGTTVIVEVLESPQFRFVTTLNDEMLLVPKSQLEGEVTLVGSVQRKLRNGEKVTLSSIIPSTTSLAPVNRAMRRAARAKKKSPGEDPLLEGVSAPACILTAVAIFQ